MRTLKFRCFDNKSNKMIENCSHVQREGIEIMQFTGLLDRHGVEIYEGDIIKILDHYDGDYHKRGANAQVTFKDGSFDHDHMGYDLAMLSLNGYCEVIGNIYEGALSEYANPDIIEQYDIQNDRSPQKGNKRGEQRAQGEQGNSSKDRAGQQKESRA